ncbi:acetyl-CoA carboxylase, carboxyltransferase subunit beta [Candidatus Omnitrophota bacterium]
MSEKPRVKAQESTLPNTKKKNIPAGLWVKCPECDELIFNKALQDNTYVCHKCQYHFTLCTTERIKLLLDKGSFKEIDANLTSLNPLTFVGVKCYEAKLEEAKRCTGLKEACLTGYGKMNGVKIAIAITDSRFIMGSMGSVVGEKITRLIENAIKKKLPLVIVSGSGGGARMYEGILSLMQMAKTSAALAKLSIAQLPFISVLTNPTMGGVMASFSSLGDIIIAEPKALLGFAGPRVIEQTIKQKLPKDFQSSEFLLDHGMIDLVIHRNELKQTISNVLEYLVA